MEAMEGGNLDQMEANHFNEDSENDDVQEVVGLVTRNKNQEWAKGKVVDWIAGLDDDGPVDSL
jgi:hypothetical protein